MVTTNLYTTISVLSLGLAYAVYVACLCYLRLLQYRADAATVLRRQKGERTLVLRAVSLLPLVCVRLL